MQVLERNIKKSSQTLRMFLSRQENISSVANLQKYPSKKSFMHESANCTFSGSSERTRFQTIEKNGCVKFVQKKYVQVVSASSKQTELNQSSEIPFQHQRSTTKILNKSDAERLVMRNRLDSKVELAKQKLQEMKRDFQRCRERKQQIMEKLQIPKIIITTTC